MTRLNAGNVTCINRFVVMLKCFDFGEKETKNNFLTLVIARGGKT